MKTDRLSWRDLAMAERVAEQISLILPAAIADGIRLAREAESGEVK